MLRFLAILFLLSSCATRPDMVSVEYLYKKSTVIAFAATLNSDEHTCFLTLYNSTDDDFLQIEVEKTTDIYAAEVDPGIYGVSGLDCDKNYFFWKNDTRVFKKIYVTPGVINYLGHLELNHKRYQMSDLPDQYSINFIYKEPIHKAFLRRVPKDLRSKIYWGFSGKPLPKRWPKKRR